RGTGAELDGLVATAARVLAWLGAAPVAFAAAHDRARTDRLDGIDVLAAAHGFRREMLDGARFVAAMVQTALVVGAPLVCVWIAAVALASSRSAFARRIPELPALVVFAAAVAATIGALGALSGQIGRARGRVALAVIVLVPWAVADATGHPACSLP